MKKGLTLLLAFVMVITLQAGPVSAQTFADTTGTNCETEVDVLSALGIVEGKAEGAYEPDSALTRAEMATILLRAMNMAENAMGQDVFTDVPSSHWAYANIAAAYQMGIVNGTSATTFAPDASVTYEQAVKMVVAALGYTVQAEAMGGYPSGYLSKAAQLDVLRGVDVGGEMTRGNMAILLYNALDKPLFEKTSYGEDSYTYDANESATLLSRYLKVEKMTGKVVETPMACAELVPSKVLSDEVRVSDGTASTVMKKGDTDAQALLGVRADVFYREDDITDTPVIVAIVPRAASKSVEIVAKDVVGGNTTAQTLVYMEDGEEKEAAISGATLVYNGRVRPMDASLLKPAIGTVRLVSETGADYNLVVVESYRNYIIESVLIDTKTVYFKNGEAPMVIDFTDNNVNIVLTDEKGAPLGLDELVEGDILSVCRDAEINTSVYRMYRSYRTVEGTIRELSEEEVTIDETIYPIAYSADPAAFRLGEKALFHLDFTGAVADVSEPEGSGRTYAWLQMAKNTVGVNPEPQLKLFTQDGEWKVFQTADYVEVNGATVAAKDLLNPGKPRAQMYLADQAPSLVDDTGAVERQLIAYETNEEGLLTKIETAYNKTRLDTADEDKVGGTFSMDFYQNDTRHSRFFDGTKPGSTLGDPGVGYDGYLEYDGTMFTKVFIRAETKYFVIPGDITNEKAFFTKKATNEIRLETIRRDDTDCQCFFDVKDNYICGAVVLRKDIQAQGTAIDDSIVEYPSYDKPAGLVLGVSRALNEDGMATTNLKVYNNSGQEVLLNLEDIEVLQYRNANARMWDEVVNGQTLKGDPAWYMLREDGTKYQPEKTSSVWKGTRIETRVNEIFMDLEALSPGDVVQYEADDSGNLLRVCVVYRCEYPGNLEFAYGGDGLRSTGLMVNYRGGNLSLNGTVKKVMDSGILTEVVLPEGTYGDYSYGLSSGIKTTRMLPNQGKMVVWNTDKQQMQVISMADVVKGDFIYSWWQTNVQNLFIVYR